MGCAILGSILFSWYTGDPSNGGVGIALGAYVAGIIKFKNPFWLITQIWKRHSK